MIHNAAIPKELGMVAELPVESWQTHTAQPICRDPHLRVSEQASHYPNKDNTVFAARSQAGTLLFQVLYIL